jgi:TetR/AcrR family transcriptional regulator, acrAB operon repressor
MRRTQEDAELTRQSLLDAALKVFSRQGYAETRLEDIADAAKVTRGAIYHHFGSKKELFQELVQVAAQNSSRAVQQAIQAGGTFLEIARRVLVYSVQLMEQDSQFRGVMALLMFNSGGSADLAAVREQRVTMGLEQVRQISGFFRMGLDQGAVRADLDPDVAATAFLSYQNGLVIMSLMAPGTVKAEQAEALADVFVMGIEK